MACGIYRQHQTGHEDHLCCNCVHDQVSIEKEPCLTCYESENNTCNFSPKIGTLGIVKAKKIQEDIFNQLLDKKVDEIINRLIENGKADAKLAVAGAMSAAIDHYLSYKDVIEASRKGE